MQRQRLVALALAILVALAPPPPSALAADCDLKLGFKALADQIPAEVGTCLENEHFNTANGNSNHATNRNVLLSTRRPSRVRHAITCEGTRRRKPSHSSVHGKLPTSSVGT